MQINPGCRQVSSRVIWRGGNAAWLTFALSKSICIITYPCAFYLGNHFFLDLPEHSELRVVRVHYLMHR